MELLNITAEGVDGNLVYRDKSGNIICTWDAANRKMSFPSGSVLDVESGGSLKIAGTAITATAAEINKVAVASFNNKSGYVARVNSGETALEYVAPTAIPVGGTFDNKSLFVARVNSGETAMECVNPNTLTIGGAFTNKSLYHVRVNSGETALEYVAPTATPTVENLGGTFANHSRHKIRVNAEETALTYVADGEMKAETGTSYAPVIGDEGRVITIENDNPITVTVPANSAVAFPLGTEIEFVQKGAGAITFAITDDTLNVSTHWTKVTNGAWSVVRLRKLTATVWVITGDLVASGS
jgi:hypothetical protein